MGKKANEKLLPVTKEELMNILMKNFPDSIYFKDCDSKFILINKACAKKFELKYPEEAKGKTDFDFFEREHAIATYEEDQKIIKTGKSSFKSEEREIYKDKPDRWITSTKMPCYDKNGNIFGILGITRDVTDRKIAEEKIKYLSFHDKLTGLYNRAYFEEEIKRLNTQRQLPLCIIFCDVNRLKEMNDNYSYDKGDKLLRKVAEILRKSFRNEDVVVRWGGDEFIIIMPLTDGRTADTIIKRIYNKCEQSSKPDFPVSISIGMAVKKKINHDIDMVINTAEKRMLINKKALKNKK